jgi:hypothetical protein
MDFQIRVGEASRTTHARTRSPQCRTRPHRWEQHGDDRHLSWVELRDVTVVQEVSQILRLDCPYRCKVNLALWLAQARPVRRRRVEEAWHRVPHGAESQDLPGVFGPLQGHDRVLQGHRERVRRERAQGSSKKHKKRVDAGKKRSYKRPIQQYYKGKLTKAYKAYLQSNAMLKQLAP